MCGIIEDLVSVIIPVYNVEQFLDECIDSVFAQTYQRLQIVIVDDGSCDLSADIIDNFALRDDRVIVVHQLNAGVAVARNIGIDSAIGEHLIFVDPDDVVNEKLIESLKKSIDSEMTLAFSNYTRDFQAFVNEEERDSEEIVSFEKDFLYKKRDGFYLWGALYSNSLIKKFRIKFVPECTIYEDACFNWIYLSISNMKFVLIDSPLYFYRISPKSLTEVNCPIEEVNYKNWCNAYKGLFTSFRCDKPHDIDLCWINRKCRNRYYEWSFSRNLSFREIRHNIQFENNKNYLALPAITRLIQGKFTFLEALIYKLAFRIRNKNT